ncbi:MAG: hypothetical protein K2O70_09080 [Desulfovibrionaceae bacterium]|nr:hypothetical protein [Desulfovibrionaceae bacterium]
MIVGERLATLRELEEYYSYEDALNLAEIALVRAHNEEAALKAQHKGG